MNKQEAALFRSGTRVDAMQTALNFARDCNGNVAHIHAEIKDRRERLSKSTRPEHRLDASPRIFLDTYIEELERIVTELESETVLAA